MKDIASLNIYGFEGYENWEVIKDPKLSPIFHIQAIEDSSARFPLIDLNLMYPEVFPIPQTFFGILTTSWDLSNTTVNARAPIRFNIETDSGEQQISANSMGITHRCWGKLEELLKRGEK